MSMIGKTRIYQRHPLASVRIEMECEFANDGSDHIIVIRFPWLEAIALMAGAFAAGWLVGWAL